mgnify:FL=1
MVEHFSSRLVRIRHLSETTKEFRFLRTDERPVSYIAGQFFRFSFRDNEGVFERSYSLGNFLDASEAEMDLVISAVPGGRASNYLFQGDLGIQAQVTGPYGRLVLPERLPKRLFLVATSAGIAPFLTMLPLLKSDNTEVVLLFGIRNRQEILYAQELTNFAREWPNFTLHVFYSQYQEELKPFEKNGYLTAFIASFNPHPKQDRFLICGNPLMVDDCFDKLKSLGFSGREVTREKYLFASQSKGNHKAKLSDDHKKLIADKLLKHRS